MYNANKALGQNFLVHKSVAENMVANLAITAGDQIIEIGSGPGFVTAILLDKTRTLNTQIVALEIDDRFIPKLQELAQGNANLTIVKDDVLKWLPQFTPKSGFKIIGSLPYYITSPILHLAAKHPSKPSRCVFLIQKEVAQKVKHLAPDGSYLSNFIQAFFEVEIVAKVGRHSFKPAPNVDSAVILLTKKETPLIDYAFIEKYEGFLHKAFSNPRKMLNKVFEKTDLEKAGINPSDRPQHVTIEKWAALFTSLTS